MDEPASKIHIGSDNYSFVEVLVRGRSSPQSTDYWDGNWISVEVNICAGAFRGEFRASLRTDELQAFHRGVQELQQAAEGVAKFETTEGQLSLVLSRNRRGIVKVQGTALDEAGIGNRLAFHFEIDQTFLAGVSAELASALVKYPVVGKRD